MPELEASIRRSEAIVYTPAPETTPARTFIGGAVRSLNYLIKSASVHQLKSTECASRRELGLLGKEYHANENHEYSYRHEEKGGRPSTVIQCSNPDI